MEWLGRIDTKQNSTLSLNDFMGEGFYNSFSLEALSQVWVWQQI